MSRTQQTSLTPLVKRQEVLHRHYAETPGDAWITDRARAFAGPNDDAVHGEIELANNNGACYQHGIHRAVGGDHDAPNPGDYLTAALAACLHSSLRMVAERIGVSIIDSEVSAAAHVDVRGALMVDTSVPVGFQHLHCDVRLKVADGAENRTLKALMTGAENCCVVFQTLKAGTRVTADWQIDQAS